MAQISCTRYQKNFLNVYPFSNYNFNMLLSVDTALAFTIPGLATQKFRLKFSRSSSAEIWVGYNKSPTIPTANTATTNTYQEIVPLDECRYVNGGDTISFICHTAASCSAQLLLLEDTTGM